MNETNLPVLLEQARDERRGMRMSAFEKLGQLDSPVAIAALVAGLDDPDDHACCSAMHALEGRHLEALSPRLPVLLKDRRPKVAVHAIEIVQTAGSQQFGRSAMLRHALRNPDCGVRSVAVGALSSIGDAEAVAALQRALKDRSIQVQTSAKGSLQKLGAL